MSDTSPRRSAIGLRDLVPVSLPRARAAGIGDRLLAYRFESALTGYGLIARPTGVLQLVSVEAGGAGTARVMSLFDVMSAGDLVEPWSALDAGAGAAAGASGKAEPHRVLWVESGAMAPAIQRAIIVDLTSPAGLR